MHYNIISSIPRTSTTTLTAAVTTRLRGREGTQWTTAPGSTVPVSMTAFPRARACCMEWSEAAAAVQLLTYQPQKGADIVGMDFTAGAAPKDGVVLLALLSCVGAGSSGISCWC